MEEFDTNLGTYIIGNKIIILFPIKVIGIPTSLTFETATILKT
jgi:hypothetical protein